MSVVKKKRKATVGPYGDYAKNSDSACINNRASLVITYISSMFYLCYLFLYFFFFISPWISESAKNGWLVVCYVQLGVWCNFNIQ